MTFKEIKTNALENNYTPEKTNKEIFQEYIRDLDLSPEDLKKKILDIGSFVGQFAQYAREHGFGDKIICLDALDVRRRNPAPDTVQAEAEKLPFKDDAFELVLSHCSVPAVYSSGFIRPFKKDKHGSTINPQELLEHTLEEMLRVLKPGGEIRLSPIMEGRVYKKHAILRAELDKILAKMISKYGVQVEDVPLHTLKFEKALNADTREGMDVAHLVKIKKLR